MIEARCKSQVSGDFEGRVPPITTAQPKEIVSIEINGLDVLLLVHDIFRQNVMFWEFKKKHYTHTFDFELMKLRFPM